MNEGAQLEVLLGIHDAEEDASEIRYRLWADGKPGPWIVRSVVEEAGDVATDDPRECVTWLGWYSYNSLLAADLIFQTASDIMLLLILKL
jgi:hypothetical protein